MRRFRLGPALALILATASVCDAAIARRVVAEGHSGGATSIATAAFASNPVSGDTIVAVCSSFSSGGTVTHNAPTDSTGANTYTQIGTTLDKGTGSKINLSLWRKENATGGTSVTVTCNYGTSSTVTVVAWVLSGANTPTSYNADTTGTTATSTNPASGASTPAPAANSFFIASTSTDGANNTATSQASWQFETNSRQTDNTSFQDLYTEDLVAATSSSAQNGQFTSVSVGWAARVASFAPSTGGVACTPTLTLLGVGRCS